jgi:hypothetical protein
MEGDLRISIRSILGESPDLFGRLEKLWGNLQKCKFLYQEGPYPAGHGERHIRNVVLNLCNLLSSYEDKVGLTPLEKAYLLAAGMIHDIAMIRMRSVGADGMASEDVRRSHPQRERIERLALDTLIGDGGFTAAEADSIVRIASAHSGDVPNGPAAQKVAELKERSRVTGESHLPQSAILLQVADFFDIGQGRLTDDVTEQEWTKTQIEHYKKHATVNTRMIPKNRAIHIYMTSGDTIYVEKESIRIPPIERARILDGVYHEAEEKITVLNEYFDFTKLRWHIEFDESLFGTRMPINSDLRPFKTTFENAFSKWRTPERGEPFPVDMMGHSLHGRFVDDAEGINEALLSALSVPGLHLRVLLLDPNIENQQMCEVYDGQSVSKNEKDRSILPLYNAGSRVREPPLEQGDIVETLNALNRDWVPRVAENSLLEVRATTRIMYMSISRFGDSLIVTPYRRKGLFRDSQSWLYPKKSPFYDAYHEVFGEIWSSQSESTVRIFKPGPRSTFRNPLKDILPKGTVSHSEKILPLDYERFLISKHLNRIKAIFGYVRGSSKDPVPPLEVEIQPSEECGLNCGHCIGRHLGKRRAASAALSSNLESLLDYVAGPWRIERFRLSGLLGDPLSEDGRQVTLGFLEAAKSKKREVVVLTNGLALESKGVIERLAKADYIHISLDAASGETFALLKGSDAFDKAVRGTKDLCWYLRRNNLKTQVGLGFVVTQENAHEVVAAISLANEIGTDFIRFKPDIRGMHAIAWRNWREAERRIKENQPESKTRVIITDAGWTHYRVPAVDRCWAQFLYSTIGADGGLYPCDHLTGNGGNTCFGTLGSFRELWMRASKEARIGVRHRECMLCPPLGWRVNRFLGQLYALSTYNDWDRVEEWISGALH